MGSKSGSSAAAPPDPRLIEAQMKSMGIQDSMIQQIMQTSADMAPLQKDQLQFGLDSAKTAYGQSQDDRNWSIGRRDALQGVQDTQIADAKDFNTEGRADELAGLAGADVTQAFSNARDQNARSMARMGVNPGSGRALAMGNQTAIAQAAALAGASTNARMGARNEGRALTDRASNALAGFPAMGMQATGAGAGYGSAGLGLANNGLAGLNSGANNALDGAGRMGSNAASMYGTMGSYKNSADQVANNAGSGAMGALGTLAGAGITAF